MKRIVLTISALLLASTAASAQAVDKYHPQKFDPAQERRMETSSSVWHVQAAETCPVPMSARQGSAGSLVAVKSGQPGLSSAKGIAQRIRLSVAGGNNAKVVSASVTVHGLTPEGRLLPVDSGDHGTSQISRHLDVAFSLDAANETGANLLLHGFSAVFSIDIDSITYADGSTRRSASGTCRVVPDSMMLVDVR